MSAPTARRVCVFAPSVQVTVTIEEGADGDDEIHFHAGGQGFWIARTLARLGGRPALVAPLGGESGDVLRSLLAVEGVELVAVAIEHDSPAYVHDRRAGQRVEIARSTQAGLGRHEQDDLYGEVLARSAEAGLCVVTGIAPGDRLPLDIYSRLASDLAAIGVPAVGDLHGDELVAFLDGGPLHTLKVSDENLVEDGRLDSAAGARERSEAIDDLVERGAQRVVLSSADHPVLARFAGRRLRVAPPRIAVVDSRGAGDAMTAALALAACDGLDPSATLALACGAGAANVTRRGLGSAAANLVEELACCVEVEEVEEVES